MDGFVVDSRFTAVYQELSCTHVKFEMLPGYPNGDVGDPVGSANL